MFSRYTGKQISPGCQESNSAAANLQRVGRTSRTQLVAAEPYVYAYNPQSIRAINVQRRESPERRLPRGVMNLAQISPGARHLVAFEQPLQAANEPTVSELTLFAFGRSIGTSGESGRLDHMHTFKIASGINSYQLMEGGIYLATGDNRLIYYKAK